MTNTQDTSFANRSLKGVLSSSSDYLGLIGVLAVEILIFGIWQSTFFSSGTFFAIAAEVPDTVIVAVGMTFVLIIAGIDLSVGSVLALSQAVLGYLMVEMGWPLSVAIAACLGTGVLCGAFSGAVSVRWALPSFIVTLGMLEIARGATYFVTESRTVYIGQAIGKLSDPIPFLGDLTWPLFICAFTVIAGQLVLSRTVFGRYMVAIGTNEEAVRLSGINPAPIKFAVFVICGFCSALAGMIQAAKMSSASPNAGIGFELTVIAAVVIGGTSLMGGRGSVVKSFLGVLIVAVLNAGLAQIGAPEYAKRPVIGVVIVLAVILDFYRSRNSKTSS
ncbi:MAG: ABC transporter permease [Verrucomicrobiota bacterium]